MNYKPQKAVCFSMGQIVSVFSRRANFSRTDRPFAALIISGKVIASTMLHTGQKKKTL